MGYLDHYQVPVLNDEDANELLAIMGLMTLERLNAIMDQI